MEQPQLALLSPASPHSSSGALESLKGTPDTRVTSYSPGDTSDNSTRRFHGSAHPSSTPSPVKFPLSDFQESPSSQSKDPFVTPGRGKRLSPTASAFQPFSNGARQSIHLNTGAISAVLSTELGICRSIQIIQPPGLDIVEVEAWLTELGDQGIQLLGPRRIEHCHGCTSIHFDDIRDACSVHASARHTRKSWSVEFGNLARGTRSDYVESDSHTSQSGQCIVFATAQPGYFLSTRIDALSATREILQHFGQLFAFVRLGSFPDGSFRAAAEFCNASAVLPAVTAIDNSSSLEGFNLALSPCSSIPAPGQRLSTAMGSLSVGDGSNSHEFPSRNSSILMTPRPTPANGLHFQPPFSMYPLMLPSPFSPKIPYMVDSLSNTTQASPMTPVSPGYHVTTPLYQTPPSPALTSHHQQSPSRPYSAFSRPDARRQHASRITRSPHHHNTSHHNHVDIHRIREGIDVRTTIMLRNIPNKVDQVMLKRIIDESSWGKYDFMYLRIDFANDCNVGYAFINFVDPLDIIDFVDARGNQRWNCFKSDKVAEISYATIQGKDCLVQKFRNSSVMLEAPHYRPKLYFTSNGPIPDLAGQEEPFPEPDNQSKMKRSCENAEHVGLFTPNAGQHFRDEQRRRRSQFDRGTRLAALEEYDYDTVVHHLYGQPPQ